MNEIKKTSNYWIKNNCTMFKYEFNDSLDK